MKDVGSNTNSGSKRRVQCKYSSIMYLAFVIRNLLYLKKKENEILLNILC